jgi:hypothetical protein
MTIELINPPDLPPQATYTQVVVAAGTTTVFIAGQEPEDVHGHSVAPADLYAGGRRSAVLPDPHLTEVLCRTAVDGIGQLSAAERVQSRPGCCLSRALAPRRQCFRRGPLRGGAAGLEP